MIFQFSLVTNDNWQKHICFCLPMYDHKSYCHSDTDNSQFSYDDDVHRIRLSIIIVSATLHNSCVKRQTIGLHRGQHRECYLCEQFRDVVFDIKEGPSFTRNRFFFINFCSSVSRNPFHLLKVHMCLCLRSTGWWHILLDNLIGFVFPWKLFTISGARHCRTWVLRM